MKLLRTLLALTLILASTAARGGDTGPFSPITFGRGIEFHDPEKRFETQLRFRVQNLFAYRTQDSDDFDAAQITAQVRRLRLRLGGWMLDPKLGYNLQLSFSRGDQDWADTAFPNVVRDATIIYRLAPTLQFSFGQTKLPGNRQRVVSSGDLQFADRSIVNAAFNLDRDFSLQALWQSTEAPTDGAVFNFKTALGSGRGRNSAASPFSFVLVGRLEALPMGQFTDNGDYFEGDLAHEPHPKLSMGVGAATNRNARRAGGQIGGSLDDPKDFVTLFGDAVLKYRGWSLGAEYMTRDAAGSPVDASGTFVLDGDGLNIQSGYFFADEWELAGRASWVNPSSELLASASSAASRDQTQYTLGLSRYLRGHRLKAQSDLTFNTEGSSDSWIARFQVELGI